MAERRKTVLIDRDGVINLDLMDYVMKWEDFKFLPGVLDGLRRLKEKGFAIAVISNQAGIGDGKFGKEALEDITEKMCDAVKIAGGAVDGVFYCLHGKHENCACRKPKTGLFEQAHRKFGFEPAETFFIGDKLSDIQAGKLFGSRTIMVLTGYGEKHRGEITPETRPDFIVPDFEAAVEKVLED